MRLKIFVWMLLVLALLCTNQSFAQTVIRTIEVEGNRRIDKDTILSQVSAQINSVLDRSVVDKDIKNIYRTGFFDQVIARERDYRDGVSLVFVVTERPSIREVLVEGNEEFSEDTVKEKLNISEKKFLDTRKVKLGIEELKKHYESKGYHNVDVQYSIVKLKDNQADLKFKITENSQMLIREVKFEGNNSLSDSELFDVIQTRRYKWWSSWATGSGVVKQEQLDADIKEITRLYLSKGHIDVRVNQPVVRTLENGLGITYKVEEGAVYNFGNIVVSGDLIENNAAKTLNGIESRKGEIFNVDILRKDTFLISEKFTDIGYAFANVNPVTDIDRVKRQVSVNFAVNKGALIHIARINLSGNGKTKDNVIRRSLKIAEGDLFSSSKIRRSQELLQRLGYFEEVNILTEPAIQDKEVDLGVAVREGSTGTFTIGGGISSSDGFIFSSRVAENNIMGTGNSASLDTVLGSERENFILSFNNPMVNDSPWSFGADLMSIMRDYDDFNSDRKGGGLNVGYPLWFLGPEFLDDVRFGVGYELMAVTIDDVEDDAAQLVKDQEGDTTASSVIPSLVRNTIDNPLDPTKGSRQLVKVELAGLGGDQEFWLSQLANTWYYPLWDSPIGVFVFSQRTQLDYGDTFNGDEVFPLYKRFLPGGINSIRGYDARELGPEDANGHEYGGNKELITNWELIFPLISSVHLNGVVFFDAGEAFDDNEAINIGDLRQAYGWGIRWRTPIAPLRFEIGYPISKEDGEKSSVINFSFGAPL